MKILSAVLIILIATASIAESSSLAEQLFSPENNKPALQMRQVQSDAYSATSATRDVSDLHPGRALMLSAIIPGAGQYYIGNKWRAVLFFGLEIAAWGSVIYFWDQGMQKDREFKDFADSHFDENKYREVEYQLAISPQWGSRGDANAYEGTFEEWTNESWNTKIQYLPAAGFTHELPTESQRRSNRSHDQQYYEMIGKYIRQFGFGWDDAYGDDPSLPYFSGVSTNSILYMDIRHDSNRLLEFSAIATQVALLNHVAAALDASFSVRAMKRDTKVELGFRSVRHNDNPVAMGGFNITW